MAPNISGRVHDVSNGLDFLAIVSRPDLPSGAGPVGDYYALHELVERHPEWNALVLELNYHDLDVAWDETGLTLLVPGRAPVRISEVSTALFLPACLEIEETQLAPVDPRSPWPRFAAENWRPISAYFESVLDAQHCLNRPSAVRATNNKLLQFDALRSAGFSLPSTSVGRGFPSAGPLDGRSVLVTKNVSEGGWKSPTEFSPAHLVTTADDGVGNDPWPTIWQEPLTADREFRIYVMGDDVVTVELARDPEVLDVRATNDGRPSARITMLRPDWAAMAVAMTRTLGLDYAVLDAIPIDDTLHVLEVNANGVWWFLPSDVAAELERHFHAWLEGEVEANRSA